MENTCQICEREIKAKTGVIAHHGYQRPDIGSGWQTDSCWGARHLPYEKSCDQLPPCIAHIKTFVENQKRMLKNLMETPPESITTIPHWIGDKRGGKVLVRPEGFDPKKNEERGSFGYGDAYAYEHHIQIYGYQSRIKSSQADLKRLEKRLADWKLVV